MTRPCDTGGGREARASAAQARDSTREIPARYCDQRRAAARRGSQRSVRTDPRGQWAWIPVRFYRKSRTESSNGSGRLGDKSIRAGREGLQALGDHCDGQYRGVQVLFRIWYQWQAKQFTIGIHQPGVRQLCDRESLVQVIKSGAFRSEKVCPTYSHQRQLSCIWSTPALLSPRFLIPGSTPSFTPSLKRHEAGQLESQNPMCCPLRHEAGQLESHNPIRCPLRHEAGQLVSKRVTIPTQIRSSSPTTVTPAKKKTHFNSSRPERFQIRVGLSPI